MTDAISLISESAKDLSSPLTKLIESVSSGIGCVYEPLGTVLQAKADAKAAIILAEANARVSAIEDESARRQTRAAQRFLAQELRRQENLDAVVSEAARYLPAKVSSDPVDPDWMHRFADDASSVSHEELRTLFARILANEVAQPGRCSRRTLSMMRDLDPPVARLLRAVAAHAWFDESGRGVLLRNVMDDKDPSQPVRFSDVVMLGENGLALPDSLGWKLTPDAKLTFHGITYRIANHGDPALTFGVPVWPLTAVGGELALASAMMEPTGARPAGLAAFAAAGVVLQEDL